MVLYGLRTEYGVTSTSFLHRGHNVMETGFTLTLHGLTFGCVLTILFLMLNQHKIWVRMKDRINSLWKEYCTAHEIDFTRLDENGK